MMGIHLKSRKIEGEMMLSEKQKKTVFKQCLHDLQKTEEIRNHLEIVDYYKNNRDRVLSLIDDFSAGEESLESYKEKLGKFLAFISQSVIETAFQPMEEEHQETMENILQNIDNLRSDIMVGIIDLDKIDTSSQLEEWGGAGVIISSDRSREGYEGDLIVHTKHSKTITWLMCRLRDIASESVNYLNKYEFYGKIAECAKKDIEKNGDTKESLKSLLIHQLDEAISLLRSWK